MAQAVGFDPSVFDYLGYRLAFVLSTHFLTLRVFEPITIKELKDFTDSDWE